jgi:hypothetical protein
MMGRLQQLYDEALADLARGRTARADATLRSAAAELDEIAAASGKASARAAGGPRDARRGRGNQDAEALQSSRQRLASLQNAVAAEIRRTTESLRQVRDRRRLRGIFALPVPAEGGWVDRSG